MIDVKLKKFVREVFPKGNIVAFTGAGISYESGIPTFRGKGGLWERYDPELFATPEGLAHVLHNDPGRMRAFMVETFSVLLAAHPNPAHLALAGLEKAGLLNGVITQNVDDLHRRAGSRSVAELHGNCFRIRCPRCQSRIMLERERVAEMVKLLQMPSDKDEARSLAHIKDRYFPKCRCGGRFRTDVVLFGETLPEEEMEKAYRMLDGCCVLLVVGSSLSVFPAASFPMHAKQRGAAVIEINLEPSEQAGLADYRAFGSAGEVLTEVLNAVRIRGRIVQD
ncbi:MAG: NAD-dependent deacylase [Deltaproteobacteria bacterium]